MDLFGYEPIRALSWWQPFGTAMLYDKVEMRNWTTSYRGLVLICTTRKPFDKQPLERRSQYVISEKWQDRLNSIMEAEMLVEYPTSILNGYAIAIGKLSEVRPSMENDMSYYNHSTTDIAHRYININRIRPFHYKGSQKWGKVDYETRKKIVLL